MGLIIAGTLGGRLASLNLLHLVWQASWLVQAVMLLLVAASVVSWAAIAFKLRELNGAEADSAAFLAAYHEGGWEAGAEAARKRNKSPLAAIYLAAQVELKRFARYAGRAADGALDDLQRRAIARQISWASHEEFHRLESRLPMLATIGSASPFVGLFGTVIGIINAFTDIGASGTASLAVVAPGIAEALIATAIGLFAAIPATVFYNVFVGRLGELQAAIELFSEELEADVITRIASQQKAPVRRTEA